MSTFEGKGGRVTINYGPSFPVASWSLETRAAEDLVDVFHCQHCDEDHIDRPFETFPGGRPSHTFCPATGLRIDLAAPEVPDA